MGFLDKAKNFMGGHGVKVAHVVIERQEPQGASLPIGDTVVNNLPPMDRDIAMVFQNYALYPHMSVYDNMAFGLKMRGVDRADIAKRVQEAADILGIGDYLKRKPRQLS